VSFVFFPSLATSPAPYGSKAPKSLFPRNCLLHSETSCPFPLPYTKDNRLTAPKARFHMGAIRLPWLSVFLTTLLHVTGKRAGVIRTRFSLVKFELNPLSTLLCATCVTLL
jgi:hypothetical protein